MDNWRAHRTPMLAGPCPFAERSSRPPKTRAVERSCGSPPRRIGADRLAPAYRAAANGASPAPCSRRDAWPGYERDPKRGTRGKPGGFLLIWPAMGLDARFSAAWLHPVYTAHPASSLDQLRAQGPCY